MSRSVRKRRRAESSQDDQKPVHGLKLWVAKDVDFNGILENGLPLRMLRDVVNDDQGWSDIDERMYSITVARLTPHPFISQLSSAIIRRKYDDVRKDSLAYVKVNGAIQVSPLKPDSLSHVEYLTDGSPMVHLKLLIIRQDKPKQPRTDSSHGTRNFGIIVRAMLGVKVKLEVKTTDTVGDLKMMIRGKEGLPVEQQRLVYAGKELEDERTVGHYKIKPDSTVHLILRLRGS